MSLLDIRRLFVTSTGRYDLVDEFDADAGANFFIQAGQRYLDLSLDAEVARARYFTSLPLNEALISIRRARVIEKVWLLKETEKVLLTLTDYAYLTDLNNAYLAYGVPATPAYYVPMNVHLAPNSVLSNIRNRWATVIQSSSGYNSLFFGVPSDLEYGIEIYGLFYSPELDSDSAKSYWTEEMPELLVAAATMSMERFYRNSEGLKDAMATVQDLLRLITFDDTAQQIVNINQMEG